MIYVNLIFTIFDCEDDYAMKFFQVLNVKMFILNWDIKSGSANGPGNSNDCDKYKVCILVKKTWKICLLKCI